MSYSEVLGLTLEPEIKYESIETLRNSHGTGTLIWGLIAGKYLNIHEAYGYPTAGWMERIDELWPLYKDEKLPLAHRAVLMLTYDYAYVEKRDYPLMARHIRQFINDFTIPSEHVNHLPRLAEIFESNPNYEAIGFYICSVSENLWNGEYNEDKDDYEPVDKAKVYSIYNMLEEVD